MTKVWITLTEPSASRIAAQLIPEGYKSICEAVTEIQILPPKINPSEKVNASDLCIFLSQHAARQYLDEVYCDAHKACTFLAIGSSTAEVLRLGGLCVVEPEHASSEGLLACPTVQSIKADDHVWIFCGENGRDILHKSLIKRCHLNVVNLYRRATRTIKNPSVVDASVIVVGSTHGFIAAANTWRALGGSALAKFVVPSDRVADLGLELGISEVVNAQGMDTQSLLNALARIENA
ncbi:uroporphyrinogen-III synthase [Pseudomonadales bacterium]|nr:uroporphyrinogen-III synthase [Pseudomonadales bacterium]